MYYTTPISSIVFPPSLKSLSSLQMFYQCLNLTTVVIQSYANADHERTFEGVTQEVRILVPEDYPYQTFGQRNVTKVLPPYKPSHRNTCQYVSYQKLYFLFLALFLA